MTETSSLSSSSSGKSAVETSPFGHLPLLVCNWKAYLSIEEAVELSAAIADLSRRTPVPLWVAASSAALTSVKAKFRGSPVELGGQNCFWEERGAFTGETTPRDLKEAGCSFTLCGHCERRQLFGETNESAAKRAEAAIKSGLKVIFCVGESKEDRSVGRIEEKIASQLNPLLKLGHLTNHNLLIAYEPNWAVGTGQVPTPEQIAEVMNIISSLLSTKGLPIVRMLYGGSVNGSNARALSAIPTVAGFLVGGATTKQDTLTTLVEALSK